MQVIACMYGRRMYVYTCIHTVGHKNEQMMFNSLKFQTQTSNINQSISIILLSQPEWSAVAHTEGKG